MRFLIIRERLTEGKMESISIFRFLLILSRIMLGLVKYRGV